MADAKKIAILVADHYEEMELWYPYFRLREAGFEPVLVGTDDTTYHGKKGHYPAKPDVTTANAQPADFAGVVVPGGYSPDMMRRDERMIELLREIGEAGKPVAAICHAGWALISAGLVEGKKVTSFFSIRDDMENAGAQWTDAEVVVDGNLITSRNPGDLPAFMPALLEALGTAKKATA